MFVKINRRKFISYCSLAATTVVFYPAIQGCSGKQNIDLNEFIKLSSILTGFKESDLDKLLADTYLKSLTEYPPSKASLAEIYSDLNIGVNKIPDSKNIEQTVLKDPQKKLLADTVINYWMTGTYRSKDGMKVSNYESMYAFKATGYLIPNAQCRGNFGFWENKPVIT